MHLLKLSFRYFSCFVFGLIITLGIFVTMLNMLSVQSVNISKLDLPGQLDFIRLIREPEKAKPKQHTVIPERPKAPPPKKPPPTIPKVELNAPQITSVKINKPQFSTNLNLNDALYLGDYHQPVSSVNVDEEIIPLVRIAPVYPSRAARLGIEGWVKLEVKINAQGGVDDVKVIESMPSNIFNRAAIKAIKRWRFRPKMVDGKAVPRVAEQQIKFKLNK